MTVLSVNVNKFALLRNARGENMPDVLALSKQCLEAGVAGITVHPRPDGRHIRWADVLDLAPLCASYEAELNIEGYPSEDFISQVLAAKPAQVTLVPDPPEALTSSFGWDIETHAGFLTQTIICFQKEGIRTSLFVDPLIKNWEPLDSILPDRVELFTYSYARDYPQNPQEAVEPYVWAAKNAIHRGVAVNAGHDLNLDNLGYLIAHVPEILEVSIGHALVCEAIQLGLDETLRRYLDILKK